MRQTLIAEKIVLSTRGLQLQRKDRDLMTDTGGISKRPEREPDSKPPRYDCKKPFRTKTKPAPDRDPDVDNDPDLKVSEVANVVASRRMALRALASLPKTFAALMRIARRT